MLKKFTKQDKRTNLEKERDSVLIIMDNMRTELNETNDKDLDETMNALRSDMKQVDSGSESYLNMTKALEILYKTKASITSKKEEYSDMNDNLAKLNKDIATEKERIAARNRIIISGSFIIAEGIIMLYFEKANVITTKLIGRLPKMRL